MPVAPVAPTIPVDPVAPATPVAPVVPVPVAPVAPTTPVEPVAPRMPVAPVGPGTQLCAPVEPRNPVAPVKPVAPTPPGIVIVAVLLPVTVTPLPTKLNCCTELVIRVVSSNTLMLDRYVLKMLITSIGTPVAPVVPTLDTDRGAKLLAPTTALGVFGRINCGVGIVSGIELLATSVFDDIGLIGTIMGVGVIPGVGATGVVGLGIYPSGATACGIEFVTGVLV